MRLRWRVFSTCWSEDDHDPRQCAGLARHRPHRHARGFRSLALMVQEELKCDPHSGDLYVFRGRRSDLIKIIWHDGEGACLFSKRLDRKRFLWPAMADGVVTVSVAQLSYLLSGIDWRMPQRSGGHKSPDELTRDQLTISHGVGDFRRRISLNCRRDAVLRSAPDRPCRRARDDRRPA